VRRTPMPDRREPMKRTRFKKRPKRQRQGWNKSGDAYYSRAHLDFVKSHRCCVPGCSSGKVVDPHHIYKLKGGGGMALQCSDLETVPLCRDHHIEWGAKRSVNGWKTSTTLGWFQAVARDMVRLSIEAGVVPAEVLEVNNA
jgi:hypothetical protein